ncbi:hypothetical protein B0H17DRAFT_1213679 [Mycena rosella]|uniref:Uncharacterized protein n=1 Tax=Mycena rosella TaxID=1033263 RepID=A0AAD7CPM9_MYCRO|nr:hypothetical protein B0H17DRAFT_1213679 [Mycena rosella]
MAGIFNNPLIPPYFPDHDPCFGDSSNTSALCSNVTDVMIAFLNITTGGADNYLDVYCSNPPSDSCAFGYCPNPDVASPAVRFSTYFTSVVSAILVLYSPETVTEAFYAQLLNVYSLIVAVLISVAEKTLTKMHSVIALTLAASPLSLYLIMYVGRSLLGRTTRLEAVFGPGMYLNRTLVLIMLPLWASVLSFTALPSQVWTFQQAACDSLEADNHIASLFFLPFIAFFAVYPEAGILIIASVVLMWGIAIFRLRKIIWKKKNRILPIGRLWRKVVNQYPFIQFWCLIVIPHSFWIFNIEAGLAYLSPREKFSATYGQLLAIFVTVPPFIQLCMLLPRVPRWFLDLAWVRFLTCRRNKPYLGERPTESVLPMQPDPTHATLLSQKLEGTPGPELEMDQLPLAYDPKSALSSRSASYN